MKIEENNNPFRESLKGFNKNDVVSYIQRLSRDYGNKEDKYKDDISKLTLDVDKYKDDVNKLLGEVRSKDAEIIELKKSAELDSALDAEIEALKLECAELRKNNEELQLQNAELQSKLDESAKMITGASDANSQVINELRKQIAELSETIQQKNAVIREKDETIDRKDAIIDEKNTIIEDLQSKRVYDHIQSADEQKIYENVMSKLGSVVYSAEKSAEEITAKAKSEAEDIIARANMKKLAVLEENNKINAEFKAKYDFMKAEHEKITESFKLMSEQYSAKLLEMNAKINNISKSIERD